MLAYTKEPMGYTSIDGKRIYGENFNFGRFGPTEITYKTYLKNKEILKECPITSEWLSKKLNRPFPDMQFTLTNLRNELDNDKIIELARLLGIEYKKNKISSLELRSLRKSIIYTIDNLRDK